MADEVQGQWLRPARAEQDDWIRDWFQEVYNQLQKMSSELGISELAEASALVDAAYRRRYPPQEVRLSTHRGPGERQRILDMLTWLEAGVQEEGESQGHMLE